MTFMGILSWVDLSIYFRQQPFTGESLKYFGEGTSERDRSLSISDGGLTLGIGMTMDD